MKTSIKRDATGMRASCKRSDFGEMKRGQFVALARTALTQKTATATLSASGRVTIPKAIRDALHLEAGVELNFALLSDGSIVLRA